MHRFYSATAVNLQEESGAILDEVSELAMAGDPDALRWLPKAIDWWLRFQRRRP